MEKILKIKNLDCAHCAAKIEKSVAKIDGVKSAKVNFMTQKLILEADDARFDAVLQAVRAAAKKVEPDCEVI